MPAQATVQNQQEVSIAVQRSLEASAYGGVTVDENWLQGVPPQQSPSPTLAPKLSSNPPLISGTPCQDVPNERLSGEGARPKDFTCFDLYVPDGKGSRLSQMNSKYSSMLSCAGNLLFIIRLHNLMEKYRTPFWVWIGLLVISMPWRLHP